MKWLGWLRRERVQAPPSEDVKQAQARLDSVKSKDAEVNRLARRLREISERDDFAELLAATFRHRP